MTLEQFLLKLVKRWMLILVCIVVLGVGAFAGSKLMKPIYQSSVVVQVAVRSGSNPADYNNLLASEQLLQTEANLAVSNPVLSEVASHYPDLTVGSLTKEVKASPDVNTQLFEIVVQDPSPTRAAELANDVANTLIKQQTQLTQQGNLQTQQQLQQDLQKTSQQISAITGQLTALPQTQANQAQITTLKTELASLQEHYSQVQAALVQVELTNAQSDNFLLVVQPAQPSQSPVQPNLLLNTGIGLLAGLLLALTLVLLLDQFDSRFLTPDVIAQALGSPVLATIFQAEAPDDVLNPTGNNVNAEAYHILRTNIGFSSVDRPLRTIVVTSPSPGDGKSVVAANLAIFMARAGKNTLLIDADFRRPRQHEQFGLPAQLMGFSNAAMTFNAHSVAQRGASSQFITPRSFQGLNTPVAHEVSLDPFIYAVDTPNLCVMPSGVLPPNPPDFLDSKAIQRFLTVLEHCQIDVIIFDTPPLLGLSDASILASKVDGTLVVVDITRASKGNLSQAKATLVHAGAHIIGAVINKQRRTQEDILLNYYSHAQKQNNIMSSGSKEINTPPFVTPVILSRQQFPAQSKMWRR